MALAERMLSSQAQYNYTTPLCDIKTFPALLKSEIFAELSSALLLTSHFREYCSIQVFVVLRLSDFLTFYDHCDHYCLCLEQNRIE